jgi:hypothetical protein
MEAPFEGDQGPDDTAAHTLVDGYKSVSISSCNIQYKLFTYFTLLIPSSSTFRCRGGSREPSTSLYPLLSFPSSINSPLVIPSMSVALYEDKTQSFLTSLLSANAK